MSKYYYNKDYFQKIDSHEKAYQLGFLYADGCITRLYKNDKIKSMSLELTLCEKDKNHLEKFRDCLESNIPIHEKIVRLNDKTFKSYRLVVSCTKMCYDLINLGCTPRKTFTLSFPTEDIVPKQFLSSFICGFFDGDGCIETFLNNGKLDIFVIFTGIERMMNDIIEYLTDLKIIRIRKPILCYDKRSKACLFRLYGDITKDFLDFIYGNSPIHLDRKYQKYIDYYKDYNPLSYHGVHQSKRNKAYIVTICIDGKRIRIGQSKDLNEAIEMRKQAEYKKMELENSPLNS